MLALALSPAGSRFGIDAWQRRRQDSTWVPPETTTAGVRFFQFMLPVIYSASGIAKMRGDWLSNPYVLWTQLHDSYQTPVSWALANILPAFAWTGFQVGTLVFEVGAPLWFAWPKTRPIAFFVGVTMHLLIGLMFGPVKWFAMLMISLLVGAYLPKPLLDRVGALLSRAETSSTRGTAKA
jgi:hypothetical protein